MIVYHCDDFCLNLRFGSKNQCAESRRDEGISASPSLPRPGSPFLSLDLSSEFLNFLTSIVLSQAVAFALSSCDIFARLSTSFRSSFNPCATRTPYSVSAL
jgi:hypothetical protein